VTQNLLTGSRSPRGTSLWGALLGKRYWGEEETANLERARAVLSQFGLLKIADSVAAELSGGQKRLVELMRAIMAQPQVLLLDEPLAGVHPTMVGSIIDAIAHLRESGVTVLMVEHDLGAVERICEEVIVMANGTVIASGRMEELRSDQQVIDAYFKG
jgi:ABC-type branched-subunit amino acid transport system ATPase component